MKSYSGKMNHMDWVRCGKRDILIKKKRRYFMSVYSEPVSESRMDDCITVMFPVT